MSNPLPLHPDHLADLRRSGLGDATIAAARIRSLTPDELPKMLTPALAAKISSAYVIPYTNHEGYYRCRLFPPVSDGRGHHVKYFQPASTSPALYIPTGVGELLADPTRSLIVTEGEKKALRCTEAGLPCVGLGGLWSWMQDGQPIPDLDEVDWFERETFIVPDARAWIRPQLVQSVFAFGQELEGRGAHVAVIKLPVGVNGKEVGLDDFLLTGTAEAFQALPHLALSHRLFDRAKQWWKGWSRRKREDAVTQEAARTLLEQDQSTRRLHPAQDVHDGTLSYGLQVGERLVLVTSGRKVFRADELPNDIVLRHRVPGPSSVSQEAALAWVDGHARGSVAAAIDGLARFFQAYVILPDPDAALWVAAWTLGSWCYRAFSIFPYLVVRSPEKRSGKTRMLRLLSKVCFNASAVTASPTEALIFRGAEKNSGTQIFDEMETRKGKGERDQVTYLTSVLNVGFEAGNTVTRMEKRGEQFVDVSYEVYAPRALAGLRSLQDTLEDRACFLYMLRRHRTEPIQRLGRQTDADAAALRAMAAHACLAQIGRIVAAVDQVQPLFEKKDIDDRVVDLWTPLLALVLVADAEQDAQRLPRVLAAMEKAADVRQAEAAAGQTPQVVAALLKIQDESKGAHPDGLAPADLLARLRSALGWEWLSSTRKLASLLNPLGLHRRRSSGPGRPYLYKFPLEALHDLRDRYAGTTAEDSAP